MLIPRDINFALPILWMILCKWIVQSQRCTHANRTKSEGMFDGEVVDFDVCSSTVLYSIICWCMFCIGNCEDS